MALQHLETLEYKLAKRGFRRGDVFLHECPACKEQAMISYIIAKGRIGGRDIKYCQACGETRSWRSGAGMEERVEDVGFDLDAFLR